MKVIGSYSTLEFPFRHGDRHIVSYSNVTGSDLDFSGGQKAGCSDSDINMFRLGSPAFIYRIISSVDIESATTTTSAATSSLTLPTVVTLWTESPSSSAGPITSVSPRSSPLGSTLSIAAKAGIGAGVSLCGITLISLITCLSRPTAAIRKHPTAIEKGPSGVETKLYHTRIGGTVLK